ncbi:hypothetical protein ASF58_22760 [Methylobacterium sp. Leaf125]|nr:hypothetical protein ASF58_22760 [Methylobacterium sp. Leaf125]
MAVSSVDRVFESLYRDAGGGENFFTGIQFARTLAHTQQEADGIFAGEDEWFRNSHKLRYVKEEAAKQIPFLIDMLVKRLDPDAPKALSSLWELGAVFREPQSQPPSLGKENPGSISDDD